MHDAALHRRGFLDLRIYANDDLGLIGTEVIADEVARVVVRRFRLRSASHGPIITFGQAENLRRGSMRTCRFTNLANGRRQFFTMR